MANYRIIAKDGKWKIGLGCKDVNRQEPQKILTLGKTPHWFQSCDPADMLESEIEFTMENVLETAIEDVHEILSSDEFESFNDREKDRLHELWSFLGKAKVMEIV